MKRSLKDIIFWSALGVYLVFVLSFVGRSGHNEYCVDVDVKMVGEVHNYFIDKHDVLDMVHETSGPVLGQHLGEIDVRAIEENLEANSAIKNAEVYAAAGAVLRVRVEQRNPILRIIDADNRSFYIDHEGFVMAASKKFAARVPVANGHLRIDWAKLHNRYLHQVLASADSVHAKQLAGLHELASFIGQHPFWSQQIQQVYINAEHEIELIPRVGAHIILLGTIDHYPEKFRNLEALYQKAFRKIGWNQYRTINLKFKNQVICTQRTL